MENVDNSIRVSQVPPLGQTSSFLLMERLSLLSNSQFSIEQQQTEESNNIFLEGSSSSLDISTKTFQQMNRCERKLSEEIDQLLEDDNDELLLLLPVLDKYESRSADCNRDQYSKTEKGRAVIDTKEAGLSEEPVESTPIYNPNDSDSQDTIPYSPTESIHGCDIIPQYVDLQPISENSTSEAEHSLDELVPHSPSETSNLFGDFYHDHVLYPAYSSPVHPLSTGTHGCEMRDSQEVSDDECFDILNSPLRDQANVQNLVKATSPKDNNDNLSTLSGDSFVAHLFDDEEDDNGFENNAEENTIESLAVVTDHSHDKVDHNISKKYKTTTTLRDYFIPPRENLIGKESAILPFATFGDEKKSNKTTESSEETKRWPRMGLPKRSIR
ncbi:hypothetical protein RMATCC62417_11656 [Rhizopus microsporus]|nr:hypothetical protein RMATCC62417_11656 [Rhizopus microsporus]